MKRKWLAVGIILLFVGTCIIPAIAQNTEDTSTSRGNWLYVGGTGPGNYTRIQNAIDNASDGDTVFVFDESSPYLENIIINTSLFLIGEGKETTIIDGTDTDSVVNITADYVTVTGFTIRNGNDTAIIINSNNTIITENILTDSSYAIYRDRRSPFVFICNNTVCDNLFINNGLGVFLWGGRDNIITKNVFSQTGDGGDGIYMMMMLNTNISFNIVSENEIGIWIMISYHSVVYRNNITLNSNFGLSTMSTYADNIFQNNFIGNNRSAISSQWFPPEIKLWKELGLPIFRRNVWRGNYWDEPRSLPYMIPGIILKLRFHFDWFPAQEPYDIPGLNY